MELCRFMEYSLAKKLKDAGFPQKGEDGNLICEGDCTIGEILEGECESHDIAYHPTLEELINTCGNPFKLKTITTTGKDEWVASNGGNGASKQIFYSEQGKTPSEAVANLYLALNKK